MSIQKQIFNSYLEGKNIFMTGPGGTGKSYIIKKIYEDAIEKNIKVKCTALTGVAALLLNCDASTIHGWANIGLCKANLSKILNIISTSKYRSYNWLNTDLLIIDEISMMSKKLFEILDKIGRYIRNCDKPFGGIQIIMSGDFFQLPPVEIENNYYFCFESDKFLDSFDSIYCLKTIYRQNGDTIYKNLLRNLRIGLITKKNLELLNSKVIKDKSIYDLPEEIIKIVPTKKQSNEINDYYLSKIKSKVYKYKRSFIEIKQDKLTIDNKKKFNLISENEKQLEMKYLQESTLTNEVTLLKKNAFVMCIANISPEENIVNGTCGKIIDFSVENLPIVEFGQNEENKIIKTIGFHLWNSETIPSIAFKQIPLILAWSVTIHKCQGLTLDRAIIDASNNIFEAGQLYVALSRVKSFDGLNLINFDINSLKINSNVIKFYKENNLL